MIERIAVSNKLKQWLYKRRQLEDQLDKCSSTNERKAIKEKLMYIYCSKSH